VPDEHDEKSRRRRARDRERRRQKRVDAYHAEQAAAPTPSMFDGKIGYRDVFGGVAYVREGSRPPGELAE
jgi:hypothetical protein